MVQALGKGARRIALGAVLFGIISLSLSAQEDPPDRVARLNYINGNVSMEPAGLDDWAPATLNRPFTIGDYLYTDDGAQAELHMDVAVLRMGPQTSFGFLNLDDQTTQIKLTEGDFYVRLRNFTSDQVFEVDTPNGAVTLLQNGVYRFRVDPNGQWSFILVRNGQAQVTGGGQSFLLDENESANISGTDQLAYDVEAAPAPDDFDNWAAQRDQREAHLQAAQYVAPTVIGYEDLDDNGDWQQSSDYGPVWYPRQVDSGWAPYHNGHWAWIDPWGWTWVDDQSWGFAPFHYGRWVFASGRWGWSPGPRVGGSRPYYAPALVAWFGGAHWGVSIGIGGGGPALGWVPLGYGEVYTPPYTCSQRYFSDVNTYNTRIVNVNITNVYNTVYVNHTVYNQQFVNARAPNAVMSMPQAAFASGRPVREAARPVPAADVARIQQARVMAPPVAPTRQSVAPTIGRSAPHPPAQVTQRQVTARAKPPAAPASFAARQQYLQQHATNGQPLNHAALRQAVHPAQAAPAVRVARAPAAARPVAVHPGAKVGNPVVAARPGTVPQPGHVTAAAPGRPAERNAARPEPAARTPQPAPARPAERNEPQPAAHGAAPNRPAERNEARPQPAARTPEPAPARPAERNEPQPAAHGTAPNRPAERNEARPQPAARTPQPAPARPAERNEPQPAAHGAPPNRPAERNEARPQPAARTPQAAPAHPAARSAPTAPAHPAERTQTARPAPQQKAPPAREEKKNTRDTKDTKR